MNQHTPAAFLERIERLALGIEVVDYLTGLRITDPIRLVREVGQRRLQREQRLRPELLLVDGCEGHPSLVRHSTCVFSVFEGELRRERGGSPVNPGALPAELLVRVTDRQRRTVARRLRVDLTQPLPVRIVDRQAPGEPRTFPLQLCPGAAYPLPARSTVVRGPVLDAARHPVRWARLEARLRSNTVGAGRVIGVAHGDDRGEYLLIVDNRAATVADLPEQLEIELGVFAPAPPAASVEVRALDPFWDLPVDTEPRVEGPLGVNLATTYSPATRTNVTIQLGRANRVEVSLP